MIYIKTIKNSSFRTEGIISFLKFIIIFFGVGGWGSAQSRILEVHVFYLSQSNSFCVFFFFFLLIFCFFLFYLYFFHSFILKYSNQNYMSIVVMCLERTYLKSLFAIWYLIFISKMKKLNTLHSWYIYASCVLFQFFYSFIMC